MPTTLPSPSVAALAGLPRRGADGGEADASSPGHGALSFVRQGARTMVTRAYATSPLRLLTPKNHGRAAWVYTSSFGGGLVDGDRVRLDVEVGAGAAAFVSTQASTKVYRSARGTSAQLAARVGDGGVLILAPDPVVCFAESRFEQHQEFDVSAAGSLVVVDWVTSGRRESGERWAFVHYGSRLVVHLDQSLLVHDAMALRREDGALEARLGRFDVLAIVAMIGVPLVQDAMSLVERYARLPVERGANLLTVATPLSHPRLGPAGCVVRLAGRSVDEVGRVIRSCLSCVPEILGDDPWSRKW